MTSYVLHLALVLRPQLGMALQRSCETSLRLFAGAVRVVGREARWWLCRGWWLLRLARAIPGTAALLVGTLWLSWPLGLRPLELVIVGTVFTRVWQRIHMRSHARLAAFLAGRWKVRCLRWSWTRLCEACQLSVHQPLPWYARPRSTGRPHPTHRTLVPRICSARVSWPHVRLLVRPVRGQTVETFQRACEALRMATNADRLRVEPVGARDVRLTFTVGDVLRVPFKAVVPQATPGQVPVPGGSVTLGRREDGKPWQLALGPHTLVVGSSGAGKGSVFWSFAFALAAGARAGLVRISGIDLKGGMEVRMGEDLFSAVATDPAEAVALLEHLVEQMKTRTKSYAGRVRSHTPTVAEPFEVVMIDELAALTAYLPERDLQRRADAAINLLCSQGRAPGFMVFACLQDPRKEVVPSRGLFTQMVGLRLKDYTETAMVLGEQAAESGAHCHRISRLTPGVGFVLPEDAAFPIRVRAWLRLRPSDPRRRREPPGVPPCRGSRAGPRRGTQAPHQRHSQREGGELMFVDGAKLAERGSQFPGFGEAAPLDLPPLSDLAAASVTARLVDGTFESWAETAAAVGYCVHPIRLVGSSMRVDADTGEILDSFNSADAPLGVVYVPCGNRREDVCPPCARRYQRDTFAMVKAGLVGGKTVPASVADNPLLFVTLTAPSFGYVHGPRPSGGQPTGGRCRPRDKTKLCPHGRPIGCLKSHAEHDPSNGSPLCDDCYNWDSAVVWQWWAPELWRRTTIAMRRALASRLCVGERGLRQVASLQYAKVAEYQARGLIHFHALIRLDGPDGPGSASPLEGRDVADAIARAIRGVRFEVPPVDNDDVTRALVWGRQLDVRVVRDGRRTDDPNGPLSAEQVAGYLAKYATKDVTSIRKPTNPPPHLARLGRTVRELHKRSLAAHGTGVDDNGRPRNTYELLGKWAHMLGFRGHFSTKSRRYAITLGRLRRARARFQILLADAKRRGEELDLEGLEDRLLADDDETTLVLGSWSFQGTGWPNPGDKALAVAAAARAREYAQWRAQTKQTNNTHSGR